MRIFIIIGFILFIAAKAFSQDQAVPKINIKSLFDENYGAPRKTVFFGFTNIGGEIYIKGLYRRQTTWRDDIKEILETYQISGGVKIRTGFFVFNPNILQIDINAGYSPETRKENYIIMPDLGEVNTLKNLDVRAVFFSSKKVSFGGNITLNENYSNRENLSDIRSRNRGYGGFLNLNNNYAPINISYKTEKWYQKEIQNGRIYNIDQSELSSTLLTRFSPYDKHEISYSHLYFLNDDNEFIKNKSITDQINMNNNFNFDKKGKYHLYITSSALDRKVNSKYTRINTFGNFGADMPRHFRLNASYGYNYTLQELQKLDQHKVNFIAGHKLYNSLNTEIFTEYIHSSHSQYKGDDSKLGFNIQYSKKIPLNGNISLAYRYAWNYKDRESSSFTVNVFNEEYILKDGSIILIDKPYVNSATLVITDVTGAIIYQPGFDYFLIPQGNYLEIQRIPGGQIANNAKVYISYTYTQPGMYSYNANNHNFRAQLSFFKNMVELYYSYAGQKFMRLMQTEYLQLNTFDQNIFGLKLNYRFVSGGVEHDIYKSAIIPYYATNYFLHFQGRIFKYFEGSLNGDLRYMTLTEENIKQNSANVAARLALSLKYNTKISLQGSYMFQDYQNIKLNLIMAGIEATTSVRKIFFTLGLQLYKRNYLNEKIYYNGGYVQISRRF